jgi:hypothetical protein
MRDRGLDEDVAADVGLAEKGPDYERHLGEPIAGVRNRPTGPPELADTDTLIERKDLGPGVGHLRGQGRPDPGRAA